MSSSATRRSRGPWALILTILVLVGGVGAWLTFKDSGTATSTIPTWKVLRGPLRITVTEGGSLQSLKSTTVVSEVEGETKIASIVPEGTVVTPEDVQQGRILVELDASSLGEKQRRQVLTVSDAQSGVTQAQEALKIQENQNESDLRKADLDVKFARIDLQRYLGAKLAEVVEARAPASEGLDLKALARDPALEGAGLQERRKRESDIDLAREEVARARDKLKWTEELLAKGFVSADEEVADRLAHKRQQVALEQADTSLALFTTYEFPKETEKLTSDLREAKEAYLRVQRQGESTLSKSRADLKGKNEKLALETTELQRIERQIASCIIRAKNPGLVVYASSEDRDSYRGEGSPIQQGASIRERQPILSIPDPKALGVRINVHESALGKVHADQPASILVDAFPDRALAGHVIRMSTLPSGANRWQNPDLKVYPTDIALDDAPPTLRPGLSAKVEILVAEIPSTVYVPLQAIATSNGKTVVWVRSSGTDEARPVKLGLSSDRFSQVLEGLSEDEVVLLAPPKEPPRAGGPAKGEPGETKPRKGRAGGGDGPAAGGPAPDTAEKTSNPAPTPGVTPSGSAGSSTPSSVPPSSAPPASGASGTKPATAPASEPKSGPKSSPNSARPQTSGS